MDTDTEPVRPWSGTLEERNGWHVARYEPTVQDASEVVVFALAAVADTEPEALRPLNESIDPDALDSLFAPTIDGRPRAGGEVTFTHDGFTVTICQGGELRIRSMTDAGNGSAGGTATGLDG